MAAERPTLFLALDDSASGVLVAVDAAGEVATRAFSGDASRRLRVNDTLDAVVLEAVERREAEADGLRFVSARPLTGDRRVARAVALQKHRTHFQFDPVDGSRLHFDGDGVVGRGDRDRPVFPRVDPAVIVVIQARGSERIVLARAVDRDYFSLVAGYVEAGENLEEAVAREVFEETGLRVISCTYWGSQPWPYGGSLMMGFHAEVEDSTPHNSGDGELAEIRWVLPQELDQFTLPGAGSIAHAMLSDAFRHATGKELHSA